MPGFQEGVKAKFIAQVWDRAGNSVTGSVSDSVLTVDQILPQLITLEITSSNELDRTMAMPGDSITFQINTNESINKPIFKIYEEIYEGAAGLGYINFSESSYKGPISKNLNENQLKSFGLNELLPKKSEVFLPKVLLIGKSSFSFALNVGVYSPLRLL